MRAVLVMLALAGSGLVAWAEVRAGLTVPVEATWPSAGAQASAAVLPSLEEQLDPLLGRNAAAGEHLAREGLGYWPLLIAAGLLSGVLNGWLGLGGMSVFIPLFIWILHARFSSPAGLVPAALINAFAAAALMGLATWWSHHGQANISYRHAGPVTLGSLFGSLAGFLLAWLFQVFAAMDVLFGVYLLVIGLMSLRQRAEGREHEPSLPQLLGIGVVGSAAGGLIGFNGNSVFIPLLRRAGLSVKEAIATGQVVGILVSVVMVLLLGASFGFGWLDLPVVLLLAVGAVLGSVLGAAIKRCLCNRSLNWALCFAYASAGLVLALRLTH